MNNVVAENVFVVLHTPYRIEYNHISANSSHPNAMHGASGYHIKNNSIRKQKAIKLPRIIPSLLFFAPILPIKLLTPGI